MVRARVGRTWHWWAVHLTHLASSLVGDDWVGRRLRLALLRAAGARIGRDSAIHGGTYVSDPSRLVVGRDCFVNRNCYLDLGGSIVLGDNVVVGHGTSLITSHHEIGPSTRRAAKAPGARSIRIEDGAWLGANVSVLPGVTIGRGAVIGTGSVVTRDIPANVVAVGAPAGVVRVFPPDEAGDGDERQGHHYAGPVRLAWSRAEPRPPSGLATRWRPRGRPPWPAPAA